MPVHERLQQSLVDGHSLPPLRFLARLSRYLIADPLGVALDHALYPHAPTTRRPWRLGRSLAHRLGFLRHMLLMHLYVGLGGLYRHL